MACKLVIFDLDGTLFNSIGGIMFSMNKVLSHYGFPMHNASYYTSLVGNGIKNLVYYALPEGSRDRAIDGCFERMKKEYKEHWNKNSYIYDGIELLLNELTKKDLKVAVNSNKDHVMVNVILNECFSKWRFDGIVGMQMGIEMKPSPKGVLSILDSVGVKPEECLYVGDSEIDITTAKNAHIPSVAVTWGFRSREQLLNYSPNWIVDKPSEILELIS